MSQYPQDPQFNPYAQPYPQQPGYYQPGYYNPYVGAKPPRPTAVTALAVLGIILGAYYILCAILFPILVFGYNPFSTLREAMAAESAAVRNLELADAVLTGLAGILLLIASIAALSLKRWARKAMLLFAIGYVIEDLVHRIISLAMHVANYRATAGREARIELIVGVGFGIILWLLGLIYPIFVWIFLRKPHVIAAFEQAAPAAAAPGYQPAYDPNYPGGYATPGA